MSPSLLLGPPGLIAPKSSGGLLGLEWRSPDAELDREVYADTEFGSSMNHQVRTYTHSRVVTK
jgi:hypothetical protein